ncbi:MAG TPA: beta-N-acetylhexosaminidase [Firmicutes bacterium]|nr:beta-N-acetylhexosaminidase [Bacillota bacterium]
MQRLHFTGDVEYLRPGLELLAPDYNYELHPDGSEVHVIRRDGPIEVVKKGESIRICYAERIHFFRALGLLLEALTNQKNAFHITEEPQFATNGAMFDVSQSNAVMNMDTAKHLIRRMAMMGLNMMMLYTEDSYVVPEEPYFGYMRGKYTHEELRELDQYATQFGIEMIPCIQTLAHIFEVLKWAPYADMRDDNTTLAVGKDKVYVFIERMIAAASQCFRTKRIHIGMDEAWWDDTFTRNHPNETKFDVMNAHLERVLAIVEKYGLEPMIWSDMYFRAAAPNGGYYCLESPIPPEVIARTPKNVRLVYWDYYHHDEEFYLEYIKRHREFGSEPLFAGGIWNWLSFGVNYGQTFSTTHAALNACKKAGLKEVFVTMWGDNGTECNWYTNLLGLQLYAEHGYAAAFDTEKLKRRFAFCTGADYDDFMNVRYIDEIPGVKPGNFETCNSSKFLMWQDILTGLFDKHIAELPLAEHYAKLTQDFTAAIHRNGRYGFLFEYLAKVCRVLTLKVDMGLKLTATYRAGDREGLRHLATNELPDLLARVKDLHQYARALWFRTNKALGWDIHDMRFGSLEARIESAIVEVQAYLDGKLAALEELDEERLYFNGRPELVRYANFYARIVSPSRIAAQG